MLLICDRLCKGNLEKNIYNFYKYVQYLWRRNAEISDDEEYNKCGNEEVNDSSQ